MRHADLAESLSTRPAPAAGWRTSSYTDRGSCVAVAECDDGHVAVRNSNHPDAGTLLFSAEAMHAWIAGIKAGEFDDLS